VGFEADALPLWLTPLSYLVLSASLALLGFLMRVSSSALLRNTSGLTGAPSRYRSVHAWWIICLSAVAIVGDILSVAQLLFMTVLILGFGQSEGPLEMLRFVLCMALLIGFLIAHTGTAVLTARHHRRLQ
jgi:hypothetical protein